jgi:hypothetical protein
MPEGVHADYDSNFAVLSVVMPGAEKGEEAEAGA